MQDLSERIFDFSNNLRQHWGIPDLSVSIITDNLTASKGFGSTPASGAVTEETIFPILSNTKLFTAVAAGILVDEGKLQWNSKFCELIPNFGLIDEYAARNLTILDALTLQSRLPR